MKQWNNNIKDKLTNHEFDFSDQAWEKMDNLLDKPNPKKSLFSFFNLKTISIMLIIALLIAITLVIPTDQNPPVETFYQNVSTSPNKNENENENKNKNKNANTNSITPISEPIPYSSPKKKKTFAEVLQNQMDVFNAHYAREKVYLHLDRTLYKPNEAIWFTVYVRDALTNTPSMKSGKVYVEWLNPKGAVEKKLTLVVRDGVAYGDIQLTEQAVGGQYTIKAYTNWQRNEANEPFKTERYVDFNANDKQVSAKKKEVQFGIQRTITISKSVIPNLRMELEFARKAYGAGDEVVANLELKTLENTALGNHEFAFAARVNGIEIINQAGKTDEKGQTKIKFKLPEGLNSNDGLLNAVIQYNGQIESISRAIPIVLNNIDVQFLAESGNFLANTQNVVAFKALNENGKPADISGEIYNDKNQKVADFKSYHQGMGAVTFTPKANTSYYAKITQPKDIPTEYALPVVQTVGYQLSLIRETKDYLELSATASQSGKVWVMATMKGKIYHSKKLKLKARKTTSFKIKKQAMPAGIATLTLFDSNKQPQAERLAFVNYDKQLNIKITTHKEKYQPREPVKLSIAVQDHVGNPVEGQFSLAVVDDKQLSFADDKQGQILSHFLVESDLTGKIEEPNFYFENPEKHPEKDQLLALDYLMLTQGWRKMNWSDELDLGFVNASYPAEITYVKGFIKNYKNEVYKNIKVTLLSGNYYYDKFKWVTTTDDKGFYEFHRFPFSNYAYEVQATVEGQKLSENVYKSSGQVDLILKKKTFDLTTYKDASLEKGKVKLKGKVVDANTGKPISGASVEVRPRLDDPIMSFTTGKDGEYSFDLDAEFYKVMITANNYLAAYKDDFFKINTNEVLVLDVGLQAYGEMGMFADGGYYYDANALDFANPVDIQRDHSNQSNNIIDLSSLLQGQVAGIAVQHSGAAPTVRIRGMSSVNPTDANIRGSRSNSNTIYIDGVKVTSNGLGGDLKSLQIVTGGIPASFGDTIGGVIRIQQKRPDQKEFEVPKGYENASPKVLKAYRNARAFKNGFYKNRKFYSPKYIVKDEPVVMRNDFRSTIFWKPNITTDSNGQASVMFYNSDDITTFNAVVEGIGNKGNIGRGEATYFTQMPVGMRMKAPAAVLYADEIALPLTLMNNTERTVKGILFVQVPNSFELLDSVSPIVELQANETKTLYLKYKVDASQHGKDMIKVVFATEGLTDAFEQPITILKKGFPVQEVFSDNSKKSNFGLDIQMPIDGTIEGKVTIYPSALGDVAESAKRMMRQPSGCFEQTSSSNYPNVLVLQYLREQNLNDFETEKRAKAFLESGYKRLTSYEIEGGGFDWFGRAPAHEGLTAYGLMQFVDMKSVYPVEQDLIDRTAVWLLSRRDGKGGWKYNERHLHAWNGGEAIRNAYIVWALCEAGYGKQIELELETALKGATESNDPYILGLMANALLANEDNRGIDLVAQLLKMRENDGSWNGKSHSMTHAKGKYLSIETTALVSLAIQKAQQRDESASSFNAKKSLDFIVQSKTPYGFGTTQSTVLAMKSLLEYSKTNTNNTEEGTAIVYVNGKKVAKAQISSEQPKPSMIDISDYLQKGENKVKVVQKGLKTGLSQDVELNYYTTFPKYDAKCAVELKTKLQSTSIKLGETTRLTTILKNVKDELATNPIAIVGIPSGLSVQLWQLKELQGKGVFDYYELKDGYVVFYFRGLNANETKTINLDLKADFSGSFEAPASVGYLYYESDKKFWAKPINVKID